MKKLFKILAIETSCDETAASVVGADQEGNPILLSNVVSSQIDLHAKTGGVVPEVASRAHMESIIPVITEALSEAKKQETRTENQTIDNKVIEQDLNSFLQEEIDYIAVTAGPGLIGSLLVGFNAGKTIAYALKKPVIPINHIEGHIYSAFINKSKKDIAFPIISLTVSGGHSSLTLMKDHGVYETIGETLDDAAGEAFDKVAQLLELGYPGGPIVSKLAQKFREKKTAESQNYKLKIENSSKGIVFPRPILNDGTFNFSFSGLKTAVLVQVKKMLIDGELTQDQNEEICAAFEDALVDVLVTKSLRAIEKYQPKNFVLAGGVAANGYLRKVLQEKITVRFPEVNFIIPEIRFCGDNAAMIAVAAFYHVIRGDIKAWNEIELDSNFRL